MPTQQHAVLEALDAYLDTVPGLDGRFTSEISAYGTYYVSLCLQFQCGVVVSVSCVLDELAVTSHRSADGMVRRWYSISDPACFDCIAADVLEILELRSKVHGPVIS